MKRIHFLAFLLYFLTACSTAPLSFEPTKDYKPVVDDITNIDGINDTYGKITDQNGAPISNVVVTDGYVFTITDEKGIYL